MHWGVRRYQNKDGTLTPAGEKRYLKKLNKASKNEMAIDAMEHIDELQAQLDKEFKNREEICDQKMDALYTKQALMLFIRSGGGLDMYV